MVIDPVVVAVLVAVVVVVDIVVFDAVRMLFRIRRNKKRHGLFLMS